jgi:hypothetical protein
LFAVAVLTTAVPASAQQRRYADEAYQAGVAQRMQADQFPALRTRRDATDPQHIRIGAKANGSCWAASGGRRVEADRVAVLARKRGSGSTTVSSTARRDVPVHCLNTVQATLRAAGLRQIL